MTDDFYEFEHICDSMPPELNSICKLNGSRSSQATFWKYLEGTGRFETTLYGFKFCPYCGEKLGDAS